MKTDLFSALRVNWLVDPVAGENTACVPLAPELQRHDFLLPEEVGHGWFEQLTLAPGVLVIRGVHRFRPEAFGRLIPLGEFEIEFSETMLAMQTIQGGTVCHRELHPPAEMILRPGHDNFRYANRFHLIPLVDTSSDSEMTKLDITYSRLTALIGEDIADGLIAGLGLDRPPASAALPIPLHVSAPLRACVSPALQGLLKNLYAQSKVLEYLCLLAAHVAAQAPRAPQPASKLDRIRELHDYLLHLEGKLPSLDELAAQYGMSARWLNDRFTQEYGMPICAFITDRRLAEARIALLESTVPIKVIAYRLGYSHVNHFSSAFRRKFGHPPGSLRHMRQAEG